jgi:DNA-binding NarL/FixJ family response regulator
MNVLHLEDSSEDALLVRRQLRRDLPEALVRWVATEAEYQKALAQDNIHVVLSDLSMPGYGGLVALDYARTHYPRIPVVILSSSEDAKTVRAVLRSGASDFVFKGELDELAGAIASALALRNGNGAPPSGLESRAKVFELSAELLRETDFSRALQKVLEAAVTLLKADRGNVLLFEEANNALRLANSIGFNKEFHERFASLPSDSPTACGRAFQRRERVVVEDIFVDPEFSKLGEKTRQFGFAAVQSTPLRGRNGRLFGILSTHLDRPGRPSEEDLGTLDLVIQEAERVFALLETS